MLRAPPAIPVAWKLLSFILENRNNAGATHAISQTSGCSDNCGGDLRRRSRAGAATAADLGAISRAEADGGAGLEVPRTHACPAGDDGNDAVGLVRQRRIAAPDHRFGRHDCDRVDVAFARPALSRSHHRGAEEIAHGLASAWAHDADRPDL